MSNRHGWQMQIEDESHAWREKTKKVECVYMCVIVCVCVVCVYACGCLHIMCVCKWGVGVGGNCREGGGVRVYFESARDFNAYWYFPTSSCVRRFMLCWCIEWEPKTNIFIFSLRPKGDDIALAPCLHPITVLLSVTVRYPHTYVIHDIYR